MQGEGDSKYKMLADAGFILVKPQWMAAVLGRTAGPHYKIVIPTSITRGFWDSHNKNIRQNNKLKSFNTYKQFTYYQKAALLHPYSNVTLIIHGP